MSIFLVRHAETESNATRRVQTPEVPLNTRGIEQSERLAERLSSEPLGLILASDYERAAHTARSIHQASGTPLEYEPALRERHYGEVRGLAYSEIAADIFALDYVPPGGESWPQFLARVARAWAAVTQRAQMLEQPVVVVTHGLVCRALGLHHLQLDPGAVPAARGFANSSLTIVDSAPPHRVSLLNCCAHLSGSAQPRGVAGL